jgi:hypothetical protein
VSVFGTSFTLTFLIVARALARVSFAHSTEHITRLFFSPQPRARVEVWRDARARLFPSHVPRCLDLKLTVTRVMRDAASCRRGVARHRATSLKYVSRRRYTSHARAWDDIISIAIGARSYDIARYQSRSTRARRATNPTVVGIGLHPRVHLTTRRWMIQRNRCLRL